MANLLQRLFRIGKSEASAALDKIEDPVKLLKLKTEELGGTLANANEGLAKVTAIKIKLLSDVEKVKQQGASYVEKATKLKELMKSGAISEEEAKSDIVLLLNKNENALTEAANLQKQADAQSKIVDNLKNKVLELKNLIETTKNKIVLLETQQKAAKANKTISKEMSSVNLDGIKSEMAALEESISLDNAEAASWDELSDSTQTDMDRIDAAIAKNSPTSNDVLLNDFLKD